MAGWAGFSEEDLHQLKRSHSNEESQERQGTQNVRKTTNLSAAPKRQKPREMIKSKTSASKKEKKNKQEAAADLLASTTTESKDDSSSSKVNPVPDLDGSERTLNQDKFAKEKDEKGEDNQEEQIPEIILEPERIQEIELTALQKMQQKQKEIEDQNKKKKAALQETVKARFKRTQAEANTLKYVHKELAHLDHLLTADVSLLRDSIEDADREYHQALKRYELAEAEFVASKLDLHRKTEKKEMLTEHLLAVIQQNEERKAKKLEELMAKLDVVGVMLEDNIGTDIEADLSCHGDNSGSVKEVKKEIKQNRNQLKEEDTSVTNEQSKNNENELGEVEKNEITC